MMLSSWSTKSWLSWFSMWNIWNTVWIRCWGNCLHLLGFWNFFVFFPELILLLIYVRLFWDRSQTTFLTFFEHLPLSVDIFYLKALTKSWNFWTTHPPTRFRTIFTDLHLFFCYKTFKNRHLLLDCICRIIRNPAGSL